MADIFGHEGESDYLNVNIREFMNRKTNTNEFKSCFTSTLKTEKWPKPRLDFVEKMDRSSGAN